MKAIIKPEKIDMMACPVCRWKTPCTPESKKLAECPSCGNDFTCATEQEKLSDRNIREKIAQNEESKRVKKTIPKKTEALAKLLKKAQRVQYNTSTKTLTAFFNDRGGFMCRGEVAERVRAMIACEEVEG